MKTGTIIIGFFVISSIFVLNCDAVRGDYDGYISNVSPSSFTGGESKNVIVTVVNTGDEANFELKAESLPPGWNIRDNEDYPYDNEIEKEIPAGGSDTFSFSITPPEEGGSGTIVWKLYYDKPWSWNNELLDTENQQVTAESGLPEYSGRITNIQPSSFIGGELKDVIVTVVNTGEETRFELIADSLPPGWNIRDNEDYPYDNQIEKDMPAGSSDTFSFSITPPEEGGSGTIVWKLYSTSLLEFDDELLDTENQQVTAESGLPEYSGSITLVSPSSFTGGNKTEVSVKVKNNGDSGTLIVLPEEVPIGWLVDDGKKDGNVDIQKDVNKGASETFIFYIRAPFEGGSGTIKWALYYDYQWPTNNIFLDSESQSVSASMGEIDYTKQDSTIGIKVDFSPDGIPIEGDFSFPVKINTVDKLNIGETVEIDVSYTKKPLTVTFSYPPSITELANDLTGGYLSYLNPVIEYLTGLILDTYHNTITYTITNPLDGYNQMLHETPFDVLVANCKIGIYLDLDGDVIGKLFIEGPVTVESDSISFLNNDKIILSVDNDASPGDEIKVGLAPIYNAYASINGMIEIKDFTGDILYSKDEQLIPTTEGKKYDYEFPPDETMGFICTVNYLPMADFSFPDNQIALSNIDFTDLSSDEDGSIVTWQWDFGDGETSTSQNPSHKYLSDGNYSVTLTVKDNNNAENSVTKTINIEKTSIKITSHSDNDIVKGLIIIKGNSNPTGGLSDIVSIEVNIDSTSGSWNIATGTTSWSYNFDTTTLSDGNHEFYFRCTDGSSYSDVISLSLNINNIIDEVDDDKIQDETTEQTPGFEVIIIIFALIYMIYWKRKK